MMHVTVLNMPHLLTLAMNTGRSPSDAEGVHSHLGEGCVGNPCALVLEVLTAELG